MQTLYVDTMNRINSVGIGSNWTGMLGAPTGNFFNIAGGNAVANVQGSDTFALWIGNTAPIPNDQFSQITVGQISAAGSDNHGIGCIVRANVNNTRVRCFATHGSSVNAYMYVAVNGVGRQMANARANVSAGDKILLTAVGTTYTMYINRIQILQATDANIPSGSFGIHYSSTETGTPLDGANNWIGGIMAQRNYGIIQFI